MRLENLPRVEARQAALRAFGNPTLLEERSREVWQWPRLESVLADVKFAFRRLRKSPGFTTTVLLTLALGIGANSAIFTLVNAILLHNLPVADPKTLIRIGDQNYGGWSIGDFSIFSTETYYLFKKSLPEFEELAAMEADFAVRPITVRRAEPQAKAQSAIATFVSGNYFRVFVSSPTALFVDGDDQKGAPITAVMSYDTWQQDFAGDPGVVGSTVFVNTKPVTIIGVSPKGFYGDRMTTSPPRYFLPMNAMDPVKRVPEFYDPNVGWAYIIGRVKAGTSIPALQAKASALLKQEFSTPALAYTFGDPLGQQVLPRTHVVLTRAAAASSRCRKVTRTISGCCSGSPRSSFLSPAPTSPIFACPCGMSRRGGSSPSAQP